MSKRDELIQKYAAHLRDKCKMEPDMELLTKVTIACGPSIYNADSSAVSATSKGEMDTVRKNFLGKKLGIADGAQMEAGLNAAIETYGKSTRPKYRAVLYYLLTKQFSKESVFS